MISPYNMRTLLRSAGLAALSVLTLLTATAPGMAADTVRFHDLYGCFPLDHHLEILEDPDQKWNIHNVTSPPLSGEFKTQSDAPQGPKARRSQKLTLTPSCRIPSFPIVF